MLVSRRPVKRNRERSDVEDTRKLKLISLSQIARYSPYSQEYLSLQARRGLLKAKKIGRNWVSSREWLEQYLEEHSLKSRPKRLKTSIKPQSFKNFGLKKLCFAMSVFLFVLVSIFSIASPVKAKFLANLFGNFTNNTTKYLVYSFKGIKEELTPFSFNAVIASLEEPPQLMAGYFAKSTDYFAKANLKFYNYAVSIVSSPQNIFANLRGRLAGESLSYLSVVSKYGLSQADYINRDIGSLTAYALKDSAQTTVKLALKAYNAFSNLSPSMLAFLIGSKQEQMLSRAVPAQDSAIPVELPSLILKLPIIPQTNAYVSTSTELAPVSRPSYGYSQAQLSRLTGNMASLDSRLKLFESAIALDSAGILRAKPSAIFEKDLRVKGATFLSNAAVSKSLTIGSPGLELQGALVKPKEPSFRIATSDLPQSPSLIVYGNSVFEAPVTINSTLEIKQGASVGGALSVNEDLNVNKNATIVGDITIGGALNVQGRFSPKQVVVEGVVSGGTVSAPVGGFGTLSSSQASVSGNAVFGTNDQNTLAVKSVATFSAPVTFDSTINIGSGGIVTGLNISGATIMASTLSVSGLGTLSGGILVNNATSTITNLVMVNSSSTNATSTTLYASGPTILAATSGNVGIGTTSPSLKLAVQGGSLISGTLFVGGSITSTSTISVQSATATSTFSTGGLAIGTNQFVVQQTSGNVGIGTTSPSRLFAVSGSGFFEGNLKASVLTVSSIESTTTATSTFSGPIASASGNFIVSSSGTTNNLLLNPYGGNVGIGSTTPPQLLSVQGSTYLTGGLGVGQATTTNGALETSARALIGGNLNVSGNTALTGFLRVDSTISTSTISTGGLAIGTNQFVVQQTSGNIGIGTTSPSQLLGVVGSAYLTGGLGVGQATTTNGALETSARALIGGNLNVSGNQYLSGTILIDSTSTSTLQGSLVINSNTTIGDSTNGTDLLFVNSRIGSNLIAQDGTRDIGSSAIRWKNIYVDTLDALTVGASSTTVSGTNVATFTINADNVTNDTEDSSLGFERGTATPNAVMKWDSSQKWFNFNFAVNVSQSTTTALVIDDGTNQNLIFNSTNGSLALFGRTLPTATATSTLSLYQVGAGRTIHVNSLATTTETVLIQNGSALTSGSGMVAINQTGSGTTIPTFSIAGSASTSTIKIVQAGSGPSALFLGGNVGIGTSTPAQLLSIAGSTYLTGGLGVGQATTTNGVLEITSNALIGGNLNVTNNAYIGGTLTVASTLSLTGSTTLSNLGVTGNAYLGDDTSDQLTLNATTTARGGLTVNNGISITGGGLTVANNSLISGGLGVGTNSTTTSGALETSARALIGGNLNVSGNIALTGVLRSDSTTATSTLAGGLAIKTSGFVYDFSTNNVGIGTTSPSQALSIQGNALISNNLNMAGLTGTSTLTWTAFPYLNLTASAEKTDINFNLNRTVQFASGNLGTQRAFLIQAPTYSFTASSTLTNAVTVSISGAPIAGALSTTTNLYALKIDSNNVRSSGVIAPLNAYGLYIDAPTGATNNYAAIFASGNVGIGTTTPRFALQVASSTNPMIAISNNTGAADLKHWTLSSQGGSLFIATSSDSLATSTIPSMVIDSNSLIGIASSTPAQRLSIQGSAYLTGGLGVGQATTTNGVLEITSNALIGGNLNVTSNTALAGTLTVTNLSTLNGGLTISNASSTITNLITINSTSTNATSTTLYVSGPTILAATSGNVGIGTTSPAQLLSVAGSTYLTGGLGVGQATTTSGALETSARALIGGNLNVSGNIALTGVLRSDSTTATSTLAGGLAIETSGFVYDFSTNRVGIGTTSPSQALSIQGNALISNNLNLAGLTGTSTLVWTAFPYLSLPASTERTDINFNLNRTVQFASGNLSTQRAFLIQAPTYSFTASSTLSDAITLSISGAPIAGALSTTTNLYALKIDSNNVRASGVIAPLNAYGLYVDAPTGATNNYGAIFASGNVGIGTTTPRFALQVASSTNPIIAISNTTGATDLKHWILSSQGGGLFIATSSDSLATSTVPSIFINPDSLVGVASSTPAQRLSIQGSTYLTGGLGVGQATTTNGVLEITSNALIGGNLNVTSNTALAGTLTVTNLSTLNGGLTISNASSTITNLLTINSTSTNATSTTLYVSGSTILAATSGNVGIGTTSPAQLLSAVGSAYITGGLGVGQATTTNGALETSARALIGGNLNVSGNVALTGFLRVDSTTSTSTFSTGGLAIGTNQFVVQQTSGNVGIGTTSPSRILAVQGNSYVSGTAFFGGALTATSTIDIQSTTATSTFSTGGLTVGTSQFVVQQTSGNVGIGTTSPWGLLAVEQGSGENVFVVSDQGTSSPSLIVKGSGNVGIGTTGPTDSIGTGGIILDVSSSSGGGIKAHFTPTATYGEFSFAKGSNGSYIDSAGAATLANNDIIFRTGRTASNFGVTEAMRINNQGNLGIGTTGPGAKLHVYENAAGLATQRIVNVNATGYSGIEFMKHDNATVGTYFGLNSDDSYFRMNLIDKSLGIINGNVGIGTTSPSQLLSIQGNALISGNLNSVASLTATGTIAFNSAARTSGSTSLFSLVAGADTGLTAATEATDIQFNLARTKTHSNGIITTQRDFLINAPTHAFTTYSTGNSITDLATLGITGAPITAITSNGTTTNAHTLYLGASTLTASTTNSYGLTVNANTGAGSNYAAAFLGGNVGIGTTSPAQLLGVAGNVYLDSRTITISTSSAASLTIALQRSATTTIPQTLHAYSISTTTQAGNPGIFSIDGANGRIGIGTTTPYGKLSVHPLAGETSLVVGSSTATYFIVDSSGNVGIGTTGPTNKLHVYGSTGQTVMIETTGADTNNASLFLKGGATNAAWAIGTNRSDLYGAADSLGIYKDSGTTGAKLVIQNSGNVGIGTTSPSQLLSIQGNALISGNLNSVASLTATSTITLNAAARTSGSSPFFSIVAGADTGLTAATEATDIQFNLARTKTHNNGIIALQRDFLINAPTHAFTTYSTGNSITDLATLGITGAPITAITSNGTTTNAHTLYLGASTLTASTTNSYGLTVNANTGAGSNYAAAFLGGNVGIGTTSPAQMLAVQSNAYISGTLFVGGAITATSSILVNNATSTITNLITVNSTSTNATSTTLYVSGPTILAATSGNVGIGTTGPGAKLEITGNLLFTKETARTISIADTTSSNTAGAALSILGAGGNGTGNGGAITLTPGAGGSTTGNTGGALNLYGGVGTTVGSGVGGTGGSINITAGNGGFGSGAENGIGGSITLTSGYENPEGGGPGGGYVGSITIQTPNARTSGRAGNVTISAGNSGYNPSVGGAMTLTTGAGTGSLAGGAFSLTTGTGGASGAGGAISLTTGAGGSSSGNSGALTLGTGAVTSGSFGTISLNQGTNTRIYVDSSGNVGIGTTSPAQMLAVQSNAYISGTLFVGGAITATSSILVNNATSTITNLITVNSTSTNATSTTLYVSGPTILAATSGNVGIGTTTPQALLSVSGDIYSTNDGGSNVFRMTSYRNNAGAPSIQGQHARGSAGSPSSTNSSDQLLALQGYGYGTSFNAGAQIIMRATEAWSASAQGSEMFFSTTPNTTTSLTQRMTIDNQGNVGIGTSTPAQMLSVQNNAYISGTLFVGGAITATSSILVNNSTSTITNLLTINSTSTNATSTTLYVSGPTILAATSGNVGIGTVSPGGKVEVNTGANSNVLITNDSVDTAYNAISLNGTRTKGSYSGIAGGRTGDSNLYLNTANDLVVQTGGGGTYAEKVRILNGGNVGIGTSTPAQMLAVQSNAYISGTLFVGGAITATSSILVNNATSTITNLITVNSTSTNATSTTLYVSGPTILAATSGNVGIGTTSPTTNLYITSANHIPLILDRSSGLVNTQVGFYQASVAKAYVGIAGNTNGMIAGSASGDLGLRNEGGNILFSTDSGVTANMYIKNGGNVGIGTTSPAQMLSVQNNAYISGTLFVGGAITATSSILVNNATSTITNLITVNSTSTNATSTTLYVSGSTILAATSGNVGIGTTGTNAKLDVAGTLRAGGSSYYVAVVNEGSGATNWVIGDNPWSWGAGKFHIGTNDASGNKVTIQSNGNLGIGTTSPAQMLAVQSNAYISGTLFVGGAITATSSILVNNATSTITNLITVNSTSTNATSTTLYVSGPTILAATSGNVGIGTTTPGAKLDVIGALCVDDSTPTCANASRTDGTVYAVNAFSQTLDLAEAYPAKDDSLEQGDLVSLDEENPVFVKKSLKNSKTPLLGVVSTKPGFYLGGFNDELFANDKKVPIALSGRVPVKVTLETGEIKVGDRIAISSVSGLARKAREGEETVGIALEPFGYNSTGSYITLSSADIDIAEIRDNSDPEFVRQAQEENRIKISKILVFINLAPQPGPTLTVKPGNVGIIGDLTISGNVGTSNQISAKSVNSEFGAFKKLTISGSDSQDLLYVAQASSTEPVFRIAGNGKLVVREDLEFSPKTSVIPMSSPTSLAVLSPSASLRALKSLPAKVIAVADGSTIKLYNPASHELIKEYELGMALSDISALEDSILVFSSDSKYRFDLYKESLEPYSGLIRVAYPRAEITGDQVMVSYPDSFKYFSPSYFTQKLDSRILAHWAYGSLKDSSPGSADLYMSGNVGLNAEGVRGKAASFDGTGVLISSGKLGVSSRFTIGTWFKFNSLTPGQKIMSGTSFAIKLGDAGKLEATVSGQKTATRKSAVSLDNSWHHVAVAYSAFTKKLDIYVDGVLANAGLEGEVPSGIEDSKLAIGEQFYGLMDDSFVSSGAYTSELVREIYLSGLRSRSYDMANTSGLPGSPKSAYADGDYLYVSGDFGIVAIDLESDSIVERIESGATSKVVGMDSPGRVTAGIVGSNLWIETKGFSLRDSLLADSGNSLPGSASGHERLNVFEDLTVSGSRILKESESGLPLFAITGDGVAEGLAFKDLSFENELVNASFEYWDSFGKPIAWNGSEKSSDSKFGSSSLKISGGTLWTDLKNAADFSSSTVTVSAWVKTSVKDDARLELDWGDGESATSFYHTGSGDWERLILTADLGSGLKSLKIKGLSSSNQALIDGVMLQRGHLPTAFAASHLDQMLKYPQYITITGAISNNSTSTTAGGVFARIPKGTFKDRVYLDQISASLDSGSASFRATNGLDGITCFVEQGSCLGTGSVYADNSQDLEVRWEASGAVDSRATVILRYYILP